MSKAIVQRLWTPEADVPVYFPAQRGLRRMPLAGMLSRIRGAEVTATVIVRYPDRTAALIRTNASPRFLDIAARAVLSERADPAKLAQAALFETTRKQLNLDSLPPYLRISRRSRLGRISHNATVIVPFATTLLRNEAPQNLSHTSIDVLRTLVAEGSEAFSPTLLYDIDLALGDVSRHALPDLEMPTGDPSVE